MSRLFHFVLPEAWRAAHASGDWAPPSLASEGFLHFSFAEQLAGTLTVHFEGKDEVWLLEVDPQSLGDALRLEASRGGAEFPHLYRALRRDEVLGWWPLTRAADGPLLPPDLDADGRHPGAPPLAPS